VVLRNYGDVALLSRGAAWQLAVTIPQELFLIRHAATDMNGTLCGQSDPPLNAMGRTQAGALAGLLGSWKVRRLYASDLQRAVQTARPLGELWRIPVEARSAFREISFGDWEGRSWSQIRAEEPDIANMDSSSEFCAPGGETFDCFRDRVLRAFKETLAECHGQTTAIVTHLGVMRVILKELSSVNSSWNPWQRIDLCSVYRIHLDRTLFERPS
jgi:broad specificity phosphatase PhoE